MNAKLKSMCTGVRPERAVKCRNERCKVCDYLCLGDVFMSKTTKSVFSISSIDVVYCSVVKYVCGVQYVESTFTKCILRFNTHKSHLNKV